MMNILTTGVLYTLVFFLSITLAVKEHLPALNQRLIDVQLSPRPSSLSAIMIEAKYQTMQDHQGQGNIFFSSSHLGNINTWALNLTSDINTESMSKKTLCFNPKVSTEEENYNGVTIAAFSTIDQDVNIDIESSWNTNYVITENSSITLSVSPQSPQVLQFQPSIHYNTLTDESYLLTVDTEYNDNKCMYVAIHDPGCPWHDDIRTVQNSKLCSRILKTGYFPIRSEQFPNSFTIALVPLQNSSECYSKGAKHGEEDSIKIVKIRIVKTVNSYIKPVILSMVIIILSSLMFFVIWGGCWKAQLHNNERRIEKRKAYDKQFQESCERQTSMLSNNGHTCLPDSESNSLTIGTGRDILPIVNILTASNTKITPENALRQKICQTMEERDNQKGKSKFAIHRLLKDKLTLKDMSIVIRDDCWHRRQRSKVFLYLVPLLSLFYLVPSGQMVFAEQQMAKATGNLEQCFLNYGCSRPWWIFDDFNHIISNSGYIIYGLVFIILVRLKSLFLPEENRTETDHLGQIGLPQQHSLFYTMGICMIMQGIFSAIFHVCPSNISLQFDTTMMYIMLILVFIKIYQFRHPDTSTNAYRSMYAFIIALLMEALSLYTFSRSGKIVFYFIFCVFYLGAILHIAIDCYYYSALKSSFILNFPIFVNHSVHNLQHCLYPKRFLLSVLFVILNFGLMFFTVFRSFEVGAKSLSTPFLIICAVNVGIFLCYYMIRKIAEVTKRPEGPDGQLRWAMRFFSFIFFLLALALGAIAMVFYTRRHQSRNSTPPESRCV